MTTTIGLFRIMLRDGEKPEIKTVNTRNGDTSVLNLNIVQYFTPGDFVSPWIKLTLWGKQAETYVNLIDHNQACYLEADIQYEGFVTEAKNAAGEDWAINRFNPKVNKVREFRLVNVVKPPRQEDRDTPTAEPSSVVTAAVSCC